MEVIDDIGRYMEVIDDIGEYKEYSKKKKVSVRFNKH